MYWSPPAGEVKLSGQVSCQLAQPTTEQRAVSRFSKMTTHAVARQLTLTQPLTENKKMKIKKRASAKRVTIMNLQWRQDDSPFALSQAASLDVNNSIR